MAQNLGRYILERTLAVGGMGEVFHARQTGPNGFDRTCVVKTMHPNLAKEPEIVELFLEEARLTARLTHPHIAQVYDFGQIDDAYYMAMELVDGPSLHTVVKTYATRGQKVPLGAVLRMVSQAAQALDYVHRLKGPDGAPLNLVHRDISPGNLLLSCDGLVKLIDFGIAKARTTQRQTAMGQIRGKLAYMSPEQMLGQPLDGRTDIYSLGLVLYEMLSGRRANPGRNEVEIMMSVKTASLTPIQSLRPDCPPSLAKVLERATARDRDQRYARAGEFSQALEQAIVETGKAVGPADLTEVAELVTMSPPKPSPGMQPHSIPSDSATRSGVRPAPPPGVPTKMEVPAAAPVAVQKPTLVEAPVIIGPNTSAGQPITQPATRSSRVPLAIGGVLFVVLGAGVGVVWAALGRQDPKPAPEVVVAPPPPPTAVQRPQPAPVAPQPSPAPVVAADSAPAPADPAPAKQPAKSRWAKREKFEKREPDPEPVKPEPAPEPAKQPEPVAVAAATTGAVEVASEPPMEVLVDGRSSGVTPARLQLPPGQHRVELREPRLALSWSRSVEVAAGGTQSLRWKPARGLLDVRPIPPHVELQISVDGVAVGPTPISAFSVWEGSRRVSAVNSATGWKAEKTVEVPPGGRVRIKVNDGAGIELAN